MPPSAISSISSSGHGPVALPHRGMGEHAHASGVTDEAQRVDRVQRVLRHVGDAAVGDVAIEGLLLGLDDAGLDHGLRDVRPSDQIVARDAPHLVERDVVARRLQLLDHHLAPPEPRVGEPSQLLLEGGVTGIDPVAEHVQAGAVVLGGELDAGHDLHPPSDPATLGLVEAGERVVVGDADAHDATFPREADVVGRTLGPVAERGMRVQVVAAHGSMFPDRTPSRRRDQAVGVTSAGPISSTLRHPVSAIAFANSDRRISSTPRDAGVSLRRRAPRSSAARRAPRRRRAPWP